MEDHDERHVRAGDLGETVIERRGLLPRSQEAILIDPVHDHERCGRDVVATRAEGAMARTSGRIVENRPGLLS